MDRLDMGSNLGKDQEQVSIVTKVVKEVSKVPVWAKLTPSTTDIVVEARGAFLGGADAVSSSNTFTSLPIFDADTLEFEIHVDGLVSTGGLGGPAILPLSLAKMSALTQAFPDKSFSGIGGISTFEQALSYFLLGCGTVQICTAAMLDHAVGPNVIRELNAGLARFIEKHAADGWTRVEDLVGIRRDRVVAQSRIRRPDEKAYHGGHESAEGYALAEDIPFSAAEPAATKP
jgi:dihydroorotate dehydrogenase